MNFLKIKNAHERDSRIRFREEGHKYWIDNDDIFVKSCTTVIGDFFEHFDKEIAVNKILNSKNYNEPTYKYYQMSREDILKQWDDANKLGSFMHKCIENYFDNIENPILPIPEFNYFLSFFDDHKDNWKIYRTEWLIFDEDLQITGAIDAVFTDENGDLILVDWKRSNKIRKTGFDNLKAKEPIDHLDDCNFTKYSLQLNLYRRILERRYAKKVIGMFLVVCHPDNETYEKINVTFLTQEIDLIFKRREEELKNIKMNLQNKKADSKIGTTIMKKELNLSPKQQEAYNMMKKGENVFLTAAGGYGKTFLIKEFTSHCFIKNYKFGVTSTTGVSAILINGSTLHSFLGIGLGKDDVSTLFNKICKNNYLRKRWQELDVLIIDEISMLSPDLFDKIEQLARDIRYNDKPFGGIQLILSGDFLQLPNVDNSDRFCFDAKSWNACIPLTNIFHLDQNFRQDDKEFQECLNEIRFGKLSDKNFDILKSREDVKLTNEFGILPTRIYSLNCDVDYENQVQLDLLYEKNNALEFYEYELIVKKWDDKIKNIDEKVKKSCNAVKTLQLCIGSQVMLLFNLDLEMKLVNGSRGVIINFVDDFPLVKFLNGETRLITRHVWDVHEKKQLVLSIEQLPLRVAYAVTVHKCQGMTIDYAEINFEGIFENGQSYVALSRVRQLSGLVIKNLHRKYIKAHERVVKYYEQFS